MLNKKMVSLFVVCFCCVVVLFSPMVFSVYQGSSEGGGVSNVGGGNIRSDGEYIFMTMEDGVLPTPYSYKGLTLTLNDSSMMEGKNCIYAKANSLTGPAVEHRTNTPIQPKNFSLKFRPEKLEVDDWYNIVLFVSSVSTTGTELIFADNKTIYTVHGNWVTETNSFRYFTGLRWTENTTYTITYSNIHYEIDNYYFDLTVSNSTTSQTLDKVYFEFNLGRKGKPQPIYGFGIQGTHEVSESSWFYDDWTVGTQAEVCTDVVLKVNETQATVSGAIDNDGSPLQNQSQSNHTVTILYDTRPYNVSYVYHFNDYNTNYANAANIIDGDDETLNYAFNPPRTWMLNNHTGNTTNTMTGNISKIEIRAKMQIPIGNTNYSFYVTPTHNYTINGTKYHVLNPYYPGADEKLYYYPDWMDITNDINSSHPDWNDVKKITCWLVFDKYASVGFINGGVGTVELRVTVNRSLDYRYNTTTVVAGNTGDTIQQTLTGLTPGQIYFYRTMINTSYTNSSSYSYGDEHYFLTKSYNCTNPTATPITETLINLSWTNGIGANTTVLVSNSEHYPTTPYDGTELYNDTGTYYHHTLTPGTPSYIRAWSYNNWTVNPLLWHYSDNYSEFDFSLIGFNCFDQETGSPVNFDIHVTNQNGSFIYNNDGDECSNTHWTNVSNIEPGDALTIIFSNSSYRSSVLTKSIYPNTVYNFSMWLIPIDSDPPVGDPCEIRSYIDSRVVTNPAVDLVIPLTHTLYSLIQVEIYNQSLYGTYGGWLFITQDSYTATTSNVTIDSSVLDTNTTMARVTYYYEDCTGTASYLYVFTVLGELYEYGASPPVPDAYVEVKRYMNTTEQYETIWSGYTDAVGQCTLYLVSHVSYKVFISKTNYTSTVTDIIADPQNRQHTFRIYYIVPGVDPSTSFHQTITFTGEHTTNTTMLITYHDKNSGTINTRILTYEVYQGSRSLISNDYRSGSHSFTLNLSVNTSRTHLIVLYFNNTQDLDVSSPYSITVYPRGIQGIYDLDKIIEDVIGPAPTGLGGWATIFSIVIAVTLLALFGPFHAGLGIIGAGVGLGLTQTLYGLFLVNTFNPLLGGLSVVIVITGILYIMMKGGEDQI